MWGRETGSRHGPRPSLDLERITAAAIEIADADGLAKVTMSSVASRMGVATMTLYRYVGSKDELLVTMADAAAPEPPDPAGRPWREYLAEWTRANRDFYLARPWMLYIARLTPPMGPRGLRWLDRAMAVLSSTGLGEGEKINIAATLTGYASSQAGLTLQLTSGSVDGSGAGGPLGYANVLAEVLDADEYPALSRAVSEGAFGEAEEWIEDADFVFGLNLLLDGIDTLIKSRRG
ncbi:MAG TPA: TetR/AcrR family transcriptional regulator [Candidatus Limnocylindrales bacterium]